MTKPVTTIKTPIRLEYQITAGRALSSFLKAIEEKRIIGSRVGPGGKVYVPPRVACPATAELTSDEVEVSDTGVITTFCVVNIPFEGQQLKPPYVCACVLLDGADIPIFHMVGEVEASKVRMGMRVRAQWVDDASLAPTLESIRYFVPTGEEDAPYESYKEHI